MEAGFTRLTKARVESLRPGVKQRDIGDPERRGLVLRIEPTDSKIWLFRYKFAGKPHRLALGAYPGMSLALARAEAQAHRDLLDRGVDPRIARRARRNGRVVTLAPSPRAKSSSSSMGSWLGARA